MIKDNVIYFGHGKIFVKANYNILRIGVLPRAYNLGQSIKYYKDIDIDDNIYFNMSYKDCQSLKVSLYNICENNTKLNFKGYEFNFDQYDEESINVLIANIDRIKEYYCTFMAV